MVILNDRPGQLCNRIWACASFIAQALHYNNQLIIPYFGDYAPLFQELDRYPNIWFIQQDNRVYYKATSFVFKVLRSLPTLFRQQLHIYIDEAHWGAENWPLELLCSKHNTVVLSGWNHPKPTEYLPDYREALRVIFRPNKVYTDRVETFFQQIRINFDIVVGVHIRRGDYQQFLGGAYYYTTEEFSAYMNKLAVQLANSRVVFLLCSNEDINPNDFLGLNISRLPNAQGIEDLYALSLCDYLIGPPSTFSMWASFYGNVPLKILKYREGPIILADFSPIVATNTFANGQVFEHVANDFAYMKGFVTTV